MLLEYKIGKFIKDIIKFLRLGDGSTFAGKFILSLDKNFLKKALSKLDLYILITGTNGKTTTSNLTSHCLSKKYNITNNKTGSNLIYGIATSFFENIGNIGVFEVDEFHINKVIKYREPDIIAITNLFRDQLDRYTEVNKIKTLWKEHFKYLKNTKFVINSDDPSLAFIFKDFNTYFYGLNLSYSRLNNIENASDSHYCPNCRIPLSYKKIYYSHLGNYECSKCGFKNPENYIQVDDIKTYGLRGMELKIGQNYYFVNVQGFYNAYNVLCSLLICNLLNFQINEFFENIKDFKSVFSRNEILHYKDKEIILMLVKNPVGFNEVLRMAKEENFDLIIISINDWTADGHDVSWLWDVDFEENINSTFIFITGNRAYDMAVRLKYANYNNFKIFENYKECINSAIYSEYKKIGIMATYTSSLLIRKYLSKFNITKSKLY
ncbi:MAG: MurT ligase domain-containing protein [candidate division WOR-3 bacterium]